MYGSHEFSYLSKGLCHMPSEQPQRLDSLLWCLSCGGSEAPDVGELRSYFSEKKLRRKQDAGQIMWFLKKNTDFWREYLSMVGHPILDNLFFKWTSVTPVG